MSNTRSVDSIGQAATAAYSPSLFAPFQKFDCLKILYIISKDSFWLDLQAKSYQDF
jgi:hypothetical protein